MPFLFGMFLFYFISLNSRLALGENLTEYQIKAAYIYKFGNYVEWPDESFANPDSPLTIGIIGADSIADNLEQIISGRTVNNRNIVVRKIYPDTSLDGIQILFVGNSENANLPGILVKTRDLPVLTVTESEESISQDSIINFVISEDKVRFDIALPAADRNNLKISSRLLQVARKVISG